LGGTPDFAETIHVGRPNVGDREALRRRFEAILDSRWLTNRGPQVREFELRLADRLGVKHCVVMCNATVALEIVTRALGMNGEVIVPSMTFIATAHALQWQEIVPVFCDIDPETHNLDVRRAEELITPRTSGIVGVHVWGRPCDVDGLTDLAEKHGLRLVFDAAHALGCTYRGRLIGSFGDAEVFSFHATKVLNSFEGGAVTTNDDALAEKVRLMQNFGFAGLDRVIHIGTNGKMSEISAAMGIVSLESFDDFVASNKRNYTQYLDELGEIPGLRVVRYDEREKNNYQFVTLQIDEQKTGVARDTLVQVLHAENVRARRYFWPGCHRMEPYRSLYPHAHLLLPHTERVASELLVLPTGSTLGPDGISTITSIIRLAITQADALKRRLPTNRWTSPPARAKGVSLTSEHS
jgi:dTDP-4-amino-4,6-dideoxygalactose transaminase